jgi:hypothetical protein
MEAASTLADTLLDDLDDLGRGGNISIDSIKMLDDDDDDGDDNDNGIAQSGRYGSRAALLLQRQGRGG